MSLQFFLLEVDFFEPRDDISDVCPVVQLLFFFCQMDYFILSKYCLLIFPISLFAGLISLHGVLRWKLSLWSLRVTKALRLGNFWILLSKRKLVGIAFASWLP